MLTITQAQRGSAEAIQKLIADTFPCPDGVNCHILFSGLSSRGDWRFNGLRVSAARASRGGTMIYLKRDGKIASRSYHAYDAATLYTLDDDAVRVAIAKYGEPERGTA